MNQGEFELETMLSIDYYAAVVLFFTFVIVVGYVLTDMFIAILNHAYHESKMEVFGDARCGGRRRVHCGSRFD
jgi:hypothetical protein